MTPVETSLVELFRRDPGEPGWLAEARAEALAGLRTRGLPTARDEDWRFTSLAPPTGMMGRILSDSLMTASRYSS